MRVSSWLRDWLGALFGPWPSLGYPRDAGSATPRLLVRPITGTFSRLHRRDRLDRERPWAMFLDGEWKWRAQERFAGADLNCGHFFALTPEGARSEAAFYGVGGDRVLLQARAHFDAVLDLTDLGCMRHCLASHASDPGEVVHRHLYGLLSFLTDQRGGGNPFTDAIGRTASRCGYDGVLFFGARALTEHQRRAIDLPDHVWELDDLIVTQEEKCAELRQDASIQNIVALSGARLVASVTEFRVEGEPWRPNPFHGITEPELDEVFEERGIPFGSDYQAEMAARCALRPASPGVPVEPVPSWRRDEP